MFAIVIGSIRWPIVVIIGLVSAAYTAYGGLYVSIVTDQVQDWALLGRFPHIHLVASNMVTYVSIL